jgi:hypothetical protein
MISDDIVLLIEQSTGGKFTDFVSRHKGKLTAGAVAAATAGAGAVAYHYSPEFANRINSAAKSLNDARMQVGANATKAVHHVGTGFSNFAKSTKGAAADLIHSAAKKSGLFNTQEPATHAPAIHTTDLTKHLPKTLNKHDIR